MGWTLNYQGDIAKEKADRAAARIYYEESLRAFRELRNGWGIASALSDLASLSCDEGDHAQAHRLYCESIRIFNELGHKRGVARVLESLATSAMAQLRPEQSLRLAGAAAALRERLGTPLLASERPRLEKALETARQKLSNAAGLKAWMEGWAMPMEQAVLEVMNCDPQAAPNQA